MEQDNNNKTATINEKQARVMVGAAAVAGGSATMGVIAYGIKTKRSFWYYLGTLIFVPAAAAYVASGIAIAAIPGETKPTAQTENNDGSSMTVGNDK